MERRNCGWWRILSALLCLMLILPAVTFGADGTEEPLITDFNGLMLAINEAREGDVLLVGDVDFTPTSPDVPYSMMNLSISKNITIKSGKDGPALFKNGALILIGSKVSGEKISCRFENIIFDGLADSEALVLSDFDYPWSETLQEYTNFVPMKAQQAITVKGNVDAAFSGCTFRNYMHEYGPVIDLRYGDYTDNAYLLELFGDHSGCTVNLDFSHCRIENNSALYDGGAMFIESNNNVNLNAENCVISGNRSGLGEYRQGGGFLYASNANLQFTGCTLENNLGNHMYEGMDLPETDTHRGGAILSDCSRLQMTDCLIKGNQASMGGAISMNNTAALFDGCRFEGNRAVWFAGNPYGTVGPWSNMGQGGAVYAEGNSGDTVTFVNCEIRNNAAAMAYGGIYGFHNENNDVSLGTYYIKMILCTYEGNHVDTEYDYTAEMFYPWASHPGDMFVNPHLTMTGCLVSDETFAGDFPHNDLPTAENGYNCLVPEITEELRNFAIPPEAAAEMLDGRYEGRLTQVHIGSNYSRELYMPEPEQPPLEPEPTVPGEPGKEPAPEKPGPWWILPVALAVILLAAAVVVFHRRRAAAPVEEVPAAPQPIIVRSRYDEEQIRRVLAAMPESQLLTGRELEVLQEILRGKKQGEVAYDLGIEVSTVKDFYKKIYTKLDVPNKDGLFAKVAQLLKEE